MAVEIKLKFAGRDLVERRDAVITSGSVETVTAAFEFDVSWDGFTKTAIFAAGDTVTRVLLDDTGVCTVPWEVLTDARQLTVGVVGMDGDRVLPSVRVPVFVAEGIYTSGTAPEAPTPDVYEQLVALAQQTQSIAQSVRDDADAGKFDGAPGTPGDDGKTPVKGVDYWTPEEQAEISAAIENANSAASTANFAADNANLAASDANTAAETAASEAYNAIDAAGTANDAASTAIAAASAANAKAAELQAKADAGDFDGKDGADGYTPVRGVDYWNADDQSEIIERTKRAVLSDTLTVNIAEGSQIDFKSAKETDVTGLRIYGADDIASPISLVIAGKNKYDQSAVSLYLNGTTAAGGVITTRALNAFDEDNYDTVPSIPNTNFLKAGKYVLSFKARLKSGTYSNNLYGSNLYYNDSGTRVKISGTAILNPIISDVYQTFAFGLELPTDSFVGWGFSVKRGAEAAIFEVTDVQIEQGDSCTEYSLPNPAYALDISPYTLSADEYLYYEESWKIRSQAENHILGDSAQIVLNSARIRAGDNLIYLRGTQPENLRLTEKIEEKVRHRIFFRKTLDDVFVFSKYDAQNDLCVRWKKKGGNNLFDIYQIIKIPNSCDRVSTSTDGGTVMITTETDWHAPYRMRATENGNGSTSYNFTGGAHDSTGGGSGGIPTASTVSLTMTADGYRLGDVEIGWCDELVFQWENQVQGYNTGEAEGFSPRYILRELHSSVFDGRVWKQEAHIIPLENIYVIEYYGLQNSGSGHWNNYAYFVGSTGNRGINDLSQAVNSGDKVAHELIRWGENDEMVMGIDPSYDIGDRSLYGGDTMKAIFTNKTTGKAYFNLIVSQTLSKSAMYSFKGYYIFRPRRIGGEGA